MGVSFGSLGYFLAPENVFNFAGSIFLALQLANVKQKQ